MIKKEDDISAMYNEMLKSSKQTEDNNYLYLIAIIINLFGGYGCSSVPFGYAYSFGSVPFGYTYSLGSGPSKVDGQIDTLKTK